MTRNAVSLRYRLAVLMVSRHWPAVVLVVALLVRIAYTAVAPTIDPFLLGDPLHGDAGSYDRIARNLLAGHGFVEWEEPSSFWPPLYPYLLAAVYGAFGYHLVLARLLNTIFGALTCLAGFALAEQIFGRKTAVLAGLGLAFHPILIYFGAWLIPESLYMPLYMGALWAAARLLERVSWRTLSLLGLLLGLSLLCKPTTSFLLPFLLIWLVLVPLRGYKGRARVARTLAVLVLAAAVVAPWTLRNYVVHRDVVLISLNGGLTFLAANNAAGFGGHVLGSIPHLEGVSVVQADRIYYSMGMQWIVGHPADYARLLTLKMARLLSPLSVATWETDYPLPGAFLARIVYTPYLLIAAWGGLRSLSCRRGSAVLYLPILQVTTAAMVFYGDTRYTIPMQPSLVIFAAFGLTGITHRAYRHLPPAIVGSQA